MHFNLHLIDTFEAFERWTEKWNDCVRHSCANRIYATHAWYRAIIRTENLEDKLFILLLERDGEVYGIAPLVRRHNYRYHLFSIRTLAFIANRTTPENLFILHRDHPAETCTRLLEHLCRFPAWDLVLLHKVRENDCTAEISYHFLKKNSAVKLGRHRNIESPYVQTDDWPSLLDSLPKKRRKEHVRIANKIKRENTFCVQRLPLGEGKQAQLERICLVSSKSWKHDLERDLLSDRKERRFYQEIIESFGEENIQIWVLSREEKIIAFEFLLLYEGVAYPLRSDYDNHYRQYSPGNYLMASILQNLCENNGIHEYNTCAHTYAYLMPWSHGTRRHINLEIFKGRGRARLLYHLKYHLVPVLKKIKPLRSRRNSGHPSQ